VVIKGVVIKGVVIKGVVVEGELATHQARVSHYLKGYLQSPLRMR